MRRACLLLALVAATALAGGEQFHLQAGDGREYGPFEFRDGAAVKLGYMEQGTARVEVEVLDIAGVDDRRGAVSGDYRFLQLGAFGSEGSAQRLQGELQALLASPVFISEVQSGESLLYRVRIGPLAGRDELEAVQQQLQKGGYNTGQPLP